MVKRNTELSVRRQCELLGITRSTVYYEVKQPDEEAVLLKEEIMSRIDYWHTTMPYLGTRKIAIQLRSEGYNAGRKLVRSYMQQMTDRARTINITPQRWNAIVEKVVVGTGG